MTKRKGGDPLPPVSDEKREHEGTGQPMVEESAVREAGPGELDEAVEKLGEAVTREAGKFDLSEQAHQSAVERMEELGDHLEPTLPGMVQNVRDFLLDVIKSRPKPWSATSPGEQRDVAAACEQVSEGLVRKIVEALRSDGRKSVRVLLTKVTLGDDTQIAGKLKAMDEDEEDEAVMMLHHSRGKHVLLTVASTDDYKQSHRPAATDEEEPAFPFEAGEHPEDDSDLVDAAEPVGTYVVKTGDHMDVGELQSCEVKIDLKTGMIVARAPEADEFNIDVREATPEELGAERERNADFDKEQEEELAE